MKTIQHTEQPTELKRRCCSMGFYLTVLLGGLWLAPGQTIASDAPGGPYDITVAEYKFPAEVDPDVLAERPTELWARVYRPAELSGGPYPLIVFLHGNHGTCGTGENPRIDDEILYTYTGECPQGYVVTPNHAGYGYLAEPLASWGYIVVSINANRGINAAKGVSGDHGLNLARGRLILKHLQRWYEWNTVGGAPDSLGAGSNGFAGKVDLGQVGIMGHSRGGEGARASYQQYRDPGSPWQTRIPGLTVKAIFEIGPVDGQTDRVLNAEGVAWNVLLPMCDGDVRNLQGVKPFDRMLRMITETPATPKSTYAVWGVNHNFYNTEWQTSDSKGCLRHEPIFDTGQTGSPAQRQTALDSVIPFFRATVGPSVQPDLNALFNPLFQLPASVRAVTPIDRGFTISPDQAFTTVFEDFSQQTGMNTYRVPNKAHKIQIKHTHAPNHDPAQRAARITWWGLHGDAYFQSNWTDAGLGRDLRVNYRTLDLRLSRRALGNVPYETSDFSIQLVAADESLSAPVQVQDYTELRGPVGGPGGLHPILQTVRIPLGDFQTTLNDVRGVRLTFDHTRRGAIYVADIQLSRADQAPTPTQAQAFAPQECEEPVMPESTDLVQLELHSANPFPVRAALPLLRIGDQTFTWGGPKDADVQTMVFSLTRAQFEALPKGASVVLQYDADDDSGPRWSFGPFARQRLSMKAQD